MWNFNVNMELLNSFDVILLISCAKKEQFNRHNATTTAPFLHLLFCIQKLTLSLFGFFDCDRRCGATTMGGAIAQHGNQSDDDEIGAIDQNPQAKLE